MLITTLSFGQVQITEIHYDDAGNDSNEGVEIRASVATNLSGWGILLYDGMGNQYATSTPALSGTLNAGSYLWIPFTGGSNPYYAINNGVGAIALFDGNDVIEFLSYGGIVTAVDGEATGDTSTDMLVTEDNGTANGLSMQLTDAGWVTGVTASPGAVNVGLTLSVAKNQIAGFAMYPNPASNGKLSISSNSSVEKLVEIYNMIGQKVYNKIVKANETIDISGLNTGFYVVKAEEEGKIATRKLIVN